MGRGPAEARLGCAGDGILDTVHEALRRVVAGVPADAWQAPTPCADWTVTQVAQHAAGDQMAYTMFITGADGPDFDPFAPSGTIDGDALEFVTGALGRAMAAFNGVDPVGEAEDLVLLNYLGREAGWARR